MELLIMFLCQLYLSPYMQDVAEPQSMWRHRVSSNIFPPFDAWWGNYLMTLEFLS
jgi:hypothetical protein